MKPPRPVTVELIFGEWRVLYADRQPGGRYRAAGVGAEGHTERSVLNWVARQPRIRLAEAKP